MEDLKEIDDKYLEAQKGGSGSEDKVLAVVVGKAYARYEVTCELTTSAPHSTQPPD